MYSHFCYESYRYVTNTSSYLEKNVFISLTHFSHFLLGLIKWVSTFSRKQCAKLHSLDRPVKKILFLHNNISISFRKRNDPIKRILPRSIVKENLKSRGVYRNGWYNNSVPFALASPVYGYVLAWKLFRRL